MPDGRWIPEPQKAPNICAITRNGKEVGPFFETTVHYAEVFADQDNRIRYKRPGILHISAQAIREMSEMAGSPFVVVTKDDWLDQQAELERTRDELADTAAQLVEAQAEVQSYKSQPPIDARALADALIVPLGEHFARKPGPKKAA